MTVKEQNKSTLKTVWFYDDIHKKNILFVVGGSKEATIEYCKNKINLTLPEWVKEVDAKTYDVENYGIIIWLRRFDRSPYDYGCLVHEIAHAADYILDRVGWVYQPGNNEPFTYLCEFLTRKFLELYKKG
jgi:hypothetical protein